MVVLVWGEKYTIKSHEGILSECNALYLDWMWVLWVHTVLKTHHRMHLRSPHFTICNYTSIKI